MVAKALLALASTLVILGGLELLLRAHPLLLGDAFANGVLSKYSARPGGIYYWDRAVRMHFMIPEFRTSMYYNRHRWTHETDGFGFRNRDPRLPSDVMLLGDSFVYGHGAEYGDTLGPLLAAESGRSVVNLARQGDSAFQEAYLLSEYLPVFRSRHVFYHFYENDIHDLGVHLSVQAMRTFVATPIADIVWPARTPTAAALRARAETERRRSWRRRFKDSLYLLKVYPWARTLWTVRPANAAPADVDDRNPTSLGWRYTRHAITYMQHVARRGGATLVIVPIVPHQPHMRPILEEIAETNGVPILDTSRLSLDDPTLWLPRDGHFSPAGARLLARIEAEYLRRASPAR